MVPVLNVTRLKIGHRHANSDLSLTGSFHGTQQAATELYAYKRMVGPNEGLRLGLYLTGIMTYGLLVW